MLRRVVPLVFSLALTSLCLFLSSGDVSWPNAWILLGLNFAASIAAMALLWRDSGLCAERGNVKAGKSWDKPAVFVVVLLGPVATWITAGLDRRLRWSESMGTSAAVAGLLVGVPAAALVAWAMHSNRFFSAVVRIQKDRGHKVVSSGLIVL